MARGYIAWILRVAAGTALVMLFGFIFRGAAVAQERQHGEEGRHDRGAREMRRGDIRHFEERDLRWWRGGHWVHTRHLGRSGWWWVIGGAWYFYPAPVYPFPNPYVPPVIAATPPPPQAAPQYWYYCGSSRAYYPYVTSCPEGWMQVVPQAAATPP
jgi:hypothetical protein